MSADDWQEYPDIIEGFNKRFPCPRISGIRSDGARIEFAFDSIYGLQWFDISRLHEKGEHYLLALRILGGVL